jgi:hypothetical protein
MGDACYAMNIPDATAQAGKGDVFYQITGPTSMAWIGMGTGTQMRGSSMFVIYMSADGTNVTLSPRTATGESMPSYDATRQAVLMEGSGVSGTQMVANIKCMSFNLASLMLT